MCVGNCKDPFVTHLKSFGYNTIRLPRANIRPLQILARSGSDLTWLGELADVFVARDGVTLPTVEADVPAGDISGQRTGDMSIGVGLSILGSVIGAMGGSKLGIDAQYQKAKSAVFEFTGVLSDIVSLAKLDQFLGGSDVNPNSVTIGKMLEADEIHVITNTIKSNKVVLEGKDSGGASIGVDVPVIQEIVGGNVKVRQASASDAKVLYEGAIPLVFGFQAVRLFYDKGVYTAFRPLEAGEASVRALDKVKDTGADMLMTQSTFLSLSGA